MFSRQADKTYLLSSDQQTCCSLNWNKKQRSDVTEKSASHTIEKNVGGNDRWKENDISS